MVKPTLRAILKNALTHFSRKDKTMFLAGYVIVALLCITVISNLSAQAPLPPIANPNLRPSCPYNIILVLDESGSIVGSSSGTAPISTLVRSGASDLVNALSGTGSRLVVMEFNSSARLAVIGGSTTYQTISSAYVVAFNNYINPDHNSTPSASNYDPEDYSCPGSLCYTNWEEAFAQVQNINSSLGLADLVIFFTDGTPTAFIDPSGSITYGTDAATVAQALAEGTTAANFVKLQGSHIFVVGIPNPSLPESNVWQISGPDKYPFPQADFMKADYSVSTSSSLQQDLSRISQAVCKVDLRLQNAVNRPTACVGDNVVFTLALRNEGVNNASGITVQDVIPSGYTYVSDNGGPTSSMAGGVVTWNISTLNAGISIFLQITVAVNASGNYGNTAQVTACPQADIDSSPNNDDGDQSEDDEAFAVVSVVSVQSCDDGDPCSIDQCSSGQCSYTFLNCNDGNSCTLDECTNNACAHTVITYTGTSHATICDNEFYFAGGALRNTSGTYVDSLMSVSGCDSIRTIVLTVLPTFRKILRVPICLGDSIYAGGHYRKLPGIYYDTLTAANGCDSILTTVVVIPTCTDADLCTYDYCDNALCYHTPQNCDDSDPCTADGCNVSCFHQPVNCDDGNPCTTDGCNVSCFHQPMNCDDGNPCTIDGCNVSCFHQPMNCDDEIACTMDTCMNQICNYIDIPVDANISEKPGFCQGTTTRLAVEFANAISYLWSTGDVTRSIEATVESSYEVTVTDANGCEGTASYSTGTSDNIFPAYSILGFKKVNLNLNTVYSGGVGVVDAAGSAVLDSTIIEESSTFVKAPAIVMTGTTSVTLQIRKSAGVALPPFESNPYPSATNVNIIAGSIVTLTDSIYGSIAIGKASTVTFTSPVINARSIVTREKVTLKFAPCTRLRVSNKVNLGKLNVFNPDGYDVIVYAGYGVKIDRSSVVTADIYVQAGNLIVNPATAVKPNFMTGSFIAGEVTAGSYTYWYWNTECDYSCDGNSSAFRVAGSQNQSLKPSPDEEIVLKAYPNPFNEKLNIEFTLPEDSRARLEIFDVSGQRVATLFDGELKASQIEKMEFHPKTANSKIYIYRLLTNRGNYYGKAVMN